MKLLSVIVPCYNESLVLNNTFQEIKKVLEKIKRDKHYEYEILFINDGSTDETLNIIMNLSQHHKEIKYISFSRNFGKESAMIAGLENSKGDAVVIMDADLQHPPYLIDEMIDKYEQGYDQVIARRNRHGEKFLRKWITKIYYKWVNNLMDVELADGIGDFRLLSRNAVDAIINMPEYNRFSKGIFSWIGFRKTVINYENKERVVGESKWNFKSLLNYAFEGVLSFNNAPLRLIIYLGVIVTTLSVLYILYSFIRIILFGIDVPGYFTLISAILLLGGIQLISTGIIGEYVGRIYYEVKNRPKYIVDKTNIGDQSDSTPKNINEYYLSKGK